MTKPVFIPHDHYKKLPEKEMILRSVDFYLDIKRRRTVRDFSTRPVPREIIEKCILAAGTAPNGANLQPWTFVVISDPSIKKKIREAAEKEEHEFYTQRAPQEWLEALEHLGTDQHKGFLEKAPYLIAIFSKSYNINKDGSKVKNYYVKESTGIATGILVTALHYCGLASLTHTPSPMGFLNSLLERPPNEKPFLLLVVGYPEENVMVPKIQKKPLEEIAVFL